MKVRNINSTETAEYTRIKRLQLTDPNSQKQETETPSSDLPNKYIDFKGYGHDIKVNENGGKIHTSKNRN